MAEKAKDPPRCESRSVILGTAATKAEGPPEAIGDELSCSFLMKGSKEHPSAELMVGIWELCRLSLDPAPSQKQESQSTA